MMNANKMSENELGNVFGGTGNGSLVYCVVRGDTLSGIAKKFGTTVAKLYELNPHIENPNLIYPGDHIRIN